MRISWWLFWKWVVLHGKIIDMEVWMDKSSTVFLGILSHTSAAGYTGRRYIREMAHFQQAMLDSQRVSMHTREELCTCICACVKKTSNTFEMSIKQTIWLGVYRLHLDIIISLDPICLLHLVYRIGWKWSNQMEMIESNLDQCACMTRVSQRKVALMCTHAVHLMSVHFNSSNLVESLHICISVNIYIYVYIYIYFCPYTYISYITVYQYIIALCLSVYLRGLKLCLFWVSWRGLARTRLRMMTSFWHPWKASTEDTCTASLAWAGKASVESVWAQGMLCQCWDDFSQS